MPEISRRSVYDGTVYGTTFEDTAYDILVGSGSGSPLTKYNIFAHFTNVTIPQGSFINSAKIVYTQYTWNQDNPGTPKTRIYFNDADDAVPPTNASGFDALDRTTAYVDWKDYDGGAMLADEEFDSPDIKTVIKEVVDRTGWASGNDMVLIHEEDGSTAAWNVFQINSHLRTESLRAKLVIDYSDSPELSGESLYSNVASIDIVANKYIPGYPTWHKSDQKINTGSSTSIVVDKPLNVSSGDLLIALISTREYTITAPSGWTLIRTEVQADTALRPRQSAYYKIAGGSEPATYTWTAGTSTNYATVCGRVTNHNPDTPIDKHSGVVATLNPVIPEITPSKAKTLLIADANTKYAYYNTSLPAGMSQIHWNNTLNTYSLLAAVREELATDSATGTRTYAISGAESYCCALMFNILNDLTEPIVATNSADDILHNSVNLNGNLTDLGEESSVDVFFEYKKVGAGSWTSTTKQSKSATGTFNQSISSLDADSDYEFRSVVEWGTTETSYGTTLEFLTLLTPLTLDGSIVDEVIRLTWT